MISPCVAFPHDALAQTGNRFPGFHCAVTTQILPVWYRWCRWRPKLQNRIPEAHRLPAAGRADGNSTGEKHLERLPPAVSILAQDEDVSPAVCWHWRQGAAAHHRAAPHCRGASGLLFTRLFAVTIVPLLCPASTAITMQCGRVGYPSVLRAPSSCLAVPPPIRLCSAVRCSSPSMASTAHTAAQTIWQTCCSAPRAHW